MSPLSARSRNPERQDSRHPVVQRSHRRIGLWGSTLNPDFRPFLESAFSTGAGLKAMIAKVLWWHVCNIRLQA